MSFHPDQEAEEIADALERATPVQIGEEFVRRAGLLLGMVADKRKFCEESTDTDLIETALQFVFDRHGETLRCWKIVDLVVPGTDAVTRAKRLHQEVARHWHAIHVRLVGLYQARRGVLKEVPRA